MTGRSVSSSAYGAVHFKMRKLFVVVLFDDNYLALPLYTHNGDGLDYKKADEFVSVQDHRAPSFQALSCHAKLVTAKLENDVDYYDPMSTAHLTHPVSRNYSLPVVYEGKLKDESTKILISLFNEYMTHGTGD